MADSLLELAGNPNWSPAQAAPQQDPLLDLAADPQGQSIHRYEGQTELREWRARVADSEENWNSWLGRHVNPFLPIKNDMLFARAQERMRTGQHEPGDAELIATQERLHQLDEGASTASQIGAGVAHIPALVVEGFTGGAVAKRVGLAIGGRIGGALAGEALGSGLAGQAGGVAIRGAATAPFMPSLYGQRVIQNNVQAGRDPLDFRGVPNALALAAVQNSIFGSLGQYAEGMGSGLPGFVARQTMRAGAGVAEQQIADLLTSAVGMDTGYGLIGDLMRGNGDKALQHLAVQAATFAAFGMLHEAQHTGPNALQVFHDTLGQAARRGKPRSAAVAEIEPAFDAINEALRANPELPKPEALKIAENLPEGPQRDMARALADGLPETKKPAPVAESPPERPNTPPPAQTAPETTPEAVKPAEAPKTLDRLTDSEVTQLAKSLLSLPKEPSRKVAEQKLRSSSFAGQLAVLEQAVIAQRGGSVQTPVHHAESQGASNEASSLIDRMRARQQQAAPHPSEPVLRTPEPPLSAHEVEAEQHFAQTKYEDIPKPLRDRVEKVADALKGLHDPEAIRQSARSAYAAGGEGGLHELLLLQEERLHPVEATPENLAKAEEELTQYVKEFQDEVARAYRLSERLALIKTSVQRAIAKRVQKASSDAQANDPGAGNAAEAVPEAAQGPAQAPGAGPAGEPAGQAPVAGSRSAGGYELTPEQWSTLSKEDKLTLGNPRAHPVLKEAIIRQKVYGSQTLLSQMPDKGISPNNDLFQGAGKEEWIGGKLPKSLFKKGGAPLDELAGDMARQYPEAFKGYEGTAQEERLLELLSENHLIDQNRYVEKNWHPALEDVKNDFYGQFFKQHPEATEAEAEQAFAKVVGAASEGGQGEKPDQRAGEQAGEEEGPASHPDDEWVTDPGDFNPADFGRPVSDAEQRNLPGGGSGESEPGGRKPRLTALQNSQVDIERQKNGLPPLMAAARRANPQVWDEAMAKLDADPQAGARLVDELAKKSRATTVDENALLLQRKIALANEHLRAMLQVIADGKPGASVDAVTMRANEAREEELYKQVDQLDRVARTTGTEWGRAGQFRRQLAKEDFSLGNMLNQATAAKGRPLTQEERAKILEMQQQIMDLQTKLDQSEAALAKSGEGAKSPLFPEMQTARVASEEAKGEFRRMLEGDRQANKPLSQRIEDLLVKIRRAFVISSPTTMAKIVAASAQRLTFTPMEEAVGAVFNKLPGLAKIAAMAPREGRGLSLKAEKQAVLDGMTKGMSDAWDNVSKGHSELDVLYGDTSSPRSWLDFVGELHAAGKAPAVRAEFTRSFLQRIDSEAARGQDVSSPAALMRIGIEAYKDSNRAKFQQDNRVVDAWKAAVNKLTAPEASAGARALGTTMKVLVPVVRIPTNLVAEAFQYAFGTVTGSVRAAQALAKGVESLKPEEADHIMRSLKKGSIGLAALALGYFNPSLIGGYYSGRRKDTDVKAGGVRTPAGEVPSYLMHNPLLEVLQMGATVRRVADQVRHGQSQGTAAGIGAGLLGLGEQVPFVRETVEIGKAFDPTSRGAFFGNLAKSLAVPQLMQWLAGRMDLDARGEPIKRHPVGVGQHIEMGVPGLRQQVPR